MSKVPIMDRAVIWKNEHFVVRLVYEEFPRQLTIVVNPVHEGHEHLPVAYLMGTNYLHLERK